MRGLGSGEKRVREAGESELHALLNLNEVEAKLCFDGLGNLAHGQVAKNHSVKFGHHGAFAELAEAAAFATRGALAVLCGEFGESGAVVDLFFEVYGFGFGFNENVAGDSAGAWVDPWLEEKNA